MQSKRDQHSDGLRTSSPPGKRAQAAREAMLRITLELLQSPTQPGQPAQASDPSPDAALNARPGEEIESLPSPTSATEQRTRLLRAIQPVLEVVTDSNTPPDSPRNIQ